VICCARKKNCLDVKVLNTHGLIDACLLSVVLCSWGHVVEDVVSRVPPPHTPLESVVTLSGHGCGAVNTQDSSVVVGAASSACPAALKTSFFLPPSPSSACTLSSTSGTHSSSRGMILIYLCMSALGHLPLLHTTNSLFARNNL